MHIQTKLLRVLQEREIQRVGGNETLIVDIRVVAATNRDLQEEMKEGRFREDLFYRLNVFPLLLPPLRERVDDLPFLVDHLLKKHAGLSQNRVTKISPTLFPDMMNYEWRGNVRELENLIKRAIIKTPGDTITAIELPASIPAPGKAAGAPADSVDDAQYPVQGVPLGDHRSCRGNLPPAHAQTL